MVRDEKFPPSMRCAGSPFTNIYPSALPAQAVAIVPERAMRDGKVASASCSGKLVPEACTTAASRLFRITPACFVTGA